MADQETEMDSDQRSPIATPLSSSTTSSASSATSTGPPWPDYIGRRRLRKRWPDLGLWRQQFGSIPRPVETDPDDFPGRHADPLQKGIYNIGQMCKMFDTVMS